MRILNAYFAGLSALVCLNAFAGESKGRVIMAGGDCESSPSSNMFFDSMSTAANRFSAGGWDVETQYDNYLARCSLQPSSPLCEKNSKAYRKNYWDCCPDGYNDSNWSVKSFARRVGVSEDRITKNTTDALIEKLNRAATELNKGQQLMLVLETHGAPERKIKYRVKRTWKDKNGKVHVRRKWVEKTSHHGVCMADGFLQMDDPRLRNALKKLNDKGVKVAISDNSCYSGGTVKSLSKYGCVISSSTPEVVTWGSSALEQLAIAAEQGKDPSKSKSLSDFYRSLLVSDRKSRTNAPTLSGFDTQEDWMHSYSEIANSTSGVKAAGCINCQVHEEKEASFENFKNFQRVIDALKKKGSYTGSLVRLMDEYEKKLKELDEQAHLEDRVAQQEQNLLNTLYGVKVDVDYKVNGELGKAVTQEIFDQAVKSLESRGELFRMGGRFASKDGVGTFEEEGSSHLSNREIWFAEKIGDEIKKINPAIWTDLSQRVAMTQLISRAERRAFEKLPADTQAKLKQASVEYNELRDRVFNVNPHLFETAVEDEMSTLMNRFRASIFDQYVGQLQGSNKEQYESCRDFKL